MQLLEESIRELRAYVDERRARGALRELLACDAAAWPEGRRGNVVLRADTAVELGSPEQESVALLVWTEALPLVRDGVLTLVGPEVGESAGRSLPFGKVAILGVTGFDEDTWQERQRELDLRRYELNLWGYMMRAASGHGREWGRVSREAVEKGFSLHTLGGALVRSYRSLPYVASAEMLFVTSSRADVRALEAIARGAARRIGARYKMATEVSRACDACGFSDVCSEADALRAVRSASGEGRRHV